MRSSWLEPDVLKGTSPVLRGERYGDVCSLTRPIGAIFNAIRQKDKYVLDADIAKCFDRIDHEQLLRKLNTYPTLRRQIRAWLKAGVMDGKELFPTSSGTPQGGVLSPLLANIALHGMENEIKKLAETCEMKTPDGKQLRKRDKRSSVSLIRYADDFVILHKDITVVQRCKEFISEWLKGMGMELNKSKTRIVHTLREYMSEKPGFDFLGFNIRQYKKGKYNCVKVRGQTLGFKTIITPSKESQKKHYQQIAEVIDRHRGQSQVALIRNLNPIIRGWCNYFSTVVSQKIFNKIWHLTVWKLIKWGIKKHRNKGKKWVYQKYFQSIGGDNWVFATRSEGQNPMRLHQHRETPIVRHVKVKGDASPYNGDLVYWSTRMGAHPEMPKRTALLLKKQKGRCNHCGLVFKNGDIIEIDHITPKSKGGLSEYNNYQLLHRHCHDEKTRTDGSLDNDVISQIKMPSGYRWIEDMLVTC
ncbi:MAG: DNA polymerase [Okeania sp. SIO3C4]|nr:DNA polymerase [Okeania sp. SIO3C4]